MRTGGRVDLAAGEAKPTIKNTEEHTHDPVRLERILGKEGVVSLGWYKLGLDRTQAIAKILNKTEDGFGTGFLIRGARPRAGLSATPS